MSEPLAVLIIEDVEDDALLLLRELRRNGFDPTWERVQTAEELRTALTGQTWDIVISDFHLPRFSAPAALDLVRQHFPHLPFLVVSGTIGEASAVELMRSGAQDYLMKGKLNRLPEVIRRELREAQVRLDRQRTELELERTKERLQLAIDASGVGLWDWFVQTGQATFNDQWAAMLGYTLEELAPITEETWKRLIHPDDQQLALSIVDRHFRREIPVYECEVRMRHRSGHWIWVLTKGKVVEWGEDGNPLRMAGTHLDITQRKQTEANLQQLNQELEARVDRRTRALKEREEQLQDFFDNASDLIQSISLETGQFLYVNRMWRETLGYSQEEVPHLTLFDVLHPDFRDHYQQLFAQMRTGEVTQVDQVELVVLTKDHQEVILEGNINVRLAEGKPIATRSIFRDVTERKQAEEALRSSEARLQAILAYAPAIIYLKDPEGRHLLINEAVTRFFGIPAQDFIGKTNAEVFPPDIAQHIDANDRIVLETQRHYEYEEDIQLADSTHTFLSVKFPLFDEDGQIYAIGGISNDITDRKQTQNALQESQRFLKIVLDTFPLYVFWKDRNSMYLGCNQHFARAAGLTSPEDIIGKTDEDLFWSETDAATYRNEDQQVMTSGEAKLSIVRKLHADGKEMWVEMNLVPLRNLAGEVIGVVGTYQDISERKEYEMRLQQANAELLRATRLKDEFLANMSHELRTPLNAILGMSEGLQESVFGSINDRQERAIATIETSGRHLLELINDILDLSKIESGKLELELSEVPIQNLCSNSLSFVKQLAHNKQLQLTSQVPNHLGHLAIEVDDRRFRQALINLLSNAVKFTPNGGSVTLSVHQDNDQLCFSVADTGIGIAPENLHRLFQSFVQIDSSLNRQYAGTGLGLALVKQIVELHGGEVSVTSEEHRGSCFTIRLPFKAPLHPLAKVFSQNLAVQSTAPIQDVIKQLQNRQVLVIEDSPAAAEQVTRYLQELDLAATIEVSGQEALTKALQLQPIAIILDIQLPQLSGWDVITQLKQHPTTQSIPIMMTSVVDEHRQAQALGAAEYLVKPFTQAQFQTAFQKLLYFNQPVSSPPSDPSPNSFPLVLLVEDNPANTETMIGYLSNRGYRIVAATNGQQAIDFVQEQVPDIILMDIQMPGMDGLEATRRIRQIPACTEIPIIALTALAMPNDRERCLNAGATEYMSKPIRLKQLATLIRELL